MIIEILKTLVPVICAVIFVAIIFTIIRDAIKGMKKTPEEWTWSVGGQTWMNDTYITREAAIEAGKLEAGGDFQIGRLQWIHTTDFHVNWCIEEIAEQAFDIVGDVADDYPDMSKEREEALGRELDRTLALFLPEPTFFEITDIEDIKLEVSR